MPLNLDPLTPAVWLNYCIPCSYNPHSLKKKKTTDIITWNKFIPQRWTRKVFCGSFFCAIYISFSHSTCFCHTVKSDLLHGEEFCGWHHREWLSWLLEVARILRSLHYLENRPNPALFDLQMRLPWITILVLYHRLMKASNCFSTSK